MKKSDIGLIGLAVMGQNFARNIANKGNKISVFNRTTETTNQFIKDHGNENLVGTKTIKEFVNTLEKPRKIIVLVKAGEAVDLVIKSLLPLLEKNDIIIDCGNSNFEDTIRREKELSTKKIHFVGCGISGGEEGALNGPSLMPGGNKEAYKQIEPIFKKAAAKDFNNKPTIAHVGENGSGHFVKMVHNGIEYGVMQLIAEAYEILRSLYKLKPNQIADIFEKYNKGPLKSYLFEIATEVLNKKEGRKFVIDLILDKAGQKGTGTWTATESLNRAVATPTITQAVFARIISGEKETRTKLSKIYKTKNFKSFIPLKKLIPVLEEALYTSMLSCYAQGFDLIQKSEWKINLSEMSRIWEGGCIIRADLLNTLHKAYKGNTSKHLFEIPELAKKLKKTSLSLREICAYTTLNGVPTPALTSSLNYFESMTSEKVSANMIQGLRDYFGAHTYERVDKKGSFHTQW
ncbi:phosphogluconate dehydrogenase (NADP(+)-dependent, decarboxylating) [Candidatus Peregrinibacteria bacterium CG10_big_fil_rev_8_21_14_0_10_36_19]|nr:MAG: phosphogluconate dehydrogenase (NADP(+)-dependent, decarboxylating) [Candidatus Peregrinibacteria bacterium CG10_big_fil_rev_8_21_14_0_10_36_19]